jgi:hypothetical protein
MAAEVFDDFSARSPQPEILGGHVPKIALKAEP